MRGLVIDMRTGIMLASLLLVGTLVATATPASATCATYAANSRICVTAQAGTPTVGNDGDVCLDTLCPSVETNSGACFSWVHSGRPLTPSC